ncbi:hypothetical protein E6O75_ATG05772 [Venturia nashicola]|uniref:Uncharacterized protein n=1 Tax=Venturia nashicola TaxID=86259 RepID=A0A4Z1NYJ4_9PEZI|nr:hypothetical protein E6O75_ATG05772 [Venturia nashicola]
MEVEGVLAEVVEDEEFVDRASRISPKQQKDRPDQHGDFNLHSTQGLPSINEDIKEGNHGAAPLSEAAVLLSNMQTHGPSSATQYLSGRTSNQISTRTSWLATRII